MNDKPQRNRRVFWQCVEIIIIAVVIVVPTLLSLFLFWVVLGTL